MSDLLFKHVPETLFHRWKNQVTLNSTRIRIQEKIKYQNYLTKGSSQNLFDCLFVRHFTTCLTFEAPILSLWECLLYLIKKLDEYWLWFITRNSITGIHDFYLNDRLSINTCSGIRVMSAKAEHDDETMFLLLYK